MAGHAVLKPRLAQVMKARSGSGDARLPRAEPDDVVVAFEAHRENRRTVQQPRVRRAVRIVATRADPPLLPARVRKRTARACPHDSPCRRYRCRRHAAPSPSRGTRPTSPAARRAGCGSRCSASPFIDPVLEGQIEARPNCGVTAVAGIPLGGMQKRPDLRRLVYLVATHAADLGGCMGRAAKLHLADVLAWQRKQRSITSAAADSGKRTIFVLSPLPSKCSRARPVAVLASGPARRLRRQGR